MSTLAQLGNELVGWLPKLDPLLAQTLVNRAWRDIRKSRRWSFLVSEGNLTAPSPITAGTVSTTQYQNTVTLDTTAAAAVNTAALSFPPLLGRQFRVSGNQIYTITAWDGLSTLTLDRLYQEAGQAGQNYIIFQCYYAAPAPDFLRWASIMDPVNSYRFRRRNLSWRKEQLDRRDPYRGAVGNPWVAATYKYGLNTYNGQNYNVPFYELWPAPMQNIGYQVLYDREGLDAQPNDTFPAIIPDELLIEGAKLKGLDWLDLNGGQIQPATKTAARASYLDLLNTAKRQDENVFLQNYFEDEQDAELSGPIDATFLQSHDVVWI